MYHREISTRLAEKCLQYLTVLQYLQFTITLKGQDFVYFLGEEPINHRSTGIPAMSSDITVPEQSLWQGRSNSCHEQSSTLPSHSTCTLGRKAKRQQTFSVTYLSLQICCLIWCCAGEDTRVTETSTQQGPHHEKEKNPTNCRDSRRNLL